jgi:type II secretory pathway predicted ATPase ExeA
MRRDGLDTTSLRTDPFGDTVNPSFYVPREATERILAELMDCGSEPAHPAVLVGPPGVGKSLLLRLVGKRLEGLGLRVSLVHPALDTEGLCLWILEGLGGTRFQDPVFAFEAYLAHLRESGSGILLLVDELYAMPLDSVRWLAHCVANSKGELRLIASALDEPSSAEKIALLGPACETILHGSPMYSDESQEYVRERLHHAGAPEATRALFDPSTVADLHERSGGNPRELNAAAARLLRIAADSKKALPTARGEIGAGRERGPSRLLVQPTRVDSCEDAS